MSETIDFQSGIVAPSSSFENSQEKLLVLKLYIEDLCKIFSLPPSCQNLLFELLCLWSENDYGYINLTPQNKAQIIKKICVSIGTFDNYLSVLARIGVLGRIGRGKFQINPHLFLDKFPSLKLSLTIEYSPDGERKIEVTF